MVAAALRGRGLAPAPAASAVRRPARRPALARASAAAPAVGGPPKAGGNEIEQRLALATSTDRLDLSNLGLSELPPEVLKLHDLKELSLAGNLIKQLPDSLGACMPHLRKLGIAGNRLRRLPESLGSMQELTGLWINGNLIEDLPDSLEDLQELRILAAGGNCLRRLPQGIGRLWQLESLGLAGNRLEELPDAFSALAAVRSIALHGNQLHELPASFTDLATVEEIWLQGNVLEALPEGWGKLKALRQLSLADNCIRVLPESFAQAPALSEVMLYGNGLTRLPKGLPDNKALRTLWVEGNPLIPSDLAPLLPGLKGLHALGLDLEQTRGLSAEALAAAGAALRVSEQAGGAADPDTGAPLPGYFKLMRNGRLVDSAAGGAGGATGAPGSDTLVVAFGSAPGVPNWAGLLKRVRTALAEAPGAPPAAADFDVLFVVDPARSWYTEAWGASTDSIPPERSYGARLAAVTDRYKRVVLLGDSMGGTASLMFAPLATSVLAFCPQVDFWTSSIRPGQPLAALAALPLQLAEALRSPCPGGIKREVQVHTGQWVHDVAQAELLPRPEATLVVHPVDSHRVASTLDTSGELVKIVAKAVGKSAGYEMK